VIVLKIWHQHTFEEIGTLIGVSPHTAAGRYRYGLEKLRLHMKGTSDERPGILGEPAGLMAASSPLGKA
jgi:DNA-directed RNA polymerase specialized sigma24 family protein